MFSNFIKVLNTITKEKQYRRDNLIVLSFYWDNHNNNKNTAILGNLDTGIFYNVINKGLNYSVTAVYDVNKESLASFDNYLYENNITLCSLEGNTSIHFINNTLSICE